MKKFDELRAETEKLPISVVEAEVRKNLSGGNGQLITPSSFFSTKRSLRPRKIVICNFPAGFFTTPVVFFKELWYMCS